MTSLHSSARQPSSAANAQHGFQQDDTTMRIPRGQYNDLVKIARQYANLCQNLMCGGIEERTIQLLSSQVSQPHATQESAAQGAANGDSWSDPSSKSSHTSPQTNVRPYSSGFRQGSEKHEQQSYQTTRWADAVSAHDDGSVSSDTLATDAEDVAHCVSEQQQHRPYFERHAARSVQLVNLADGTTHKDITAAIRGGLILDLYLKSKDRTAAVSFVHAVDAKAFYNHVRKNDLYIKNKRVDIRWNDRQYILPGYIAQKIGGGATRNLVVRGHDPNTTEQSIRDDLEHIHNLIVVDIDIVGDNFFISTNSVSNAMFARTCMMSRLKYKGSRIEWDFDECAQPLGRMAVQRRPVPSATPVAKLAMNPLANRFQLLAMDC